MYIICVQDQVQVAYDETAAGQMGATDSAVHTACQVTCF